VARGPKVEWSESLSSRVGLHVLLTPDALVRFMPILSSSRCIIRCPRRCVLARDAGSSAGWLFSSVDLLLSGGDFELRDDLYPFRSIVCATLGQIDVVKVCLCIAEC
jgi:hypothetical protein